MECGKAGAVRPALPKTHEPNRRRAASRLACGYSSEAKLVVPGWRGCSDGGANPPTSTFSFDGPAGRNEINKPGQVFIISTGIAKAEEVYLFHGRVYGS